MNEIQSYRLGNQSKEYEVSEKYIGWTPNSFKDWHNTLTDDDGINRRSRPFPLTLVSPDGSQRVSIIVHNPIIKDAFPSNFFVETRTKNWSDFALISLEETPDTIFIIPLH